MQASSHSGAIPTNSQSANIAGLNGRLSLAGTNGPGPQIVTPENFIFENVDPAHSDGDDDSDAEMSPSVQFDRGAGQGQGHLSPSGLKPGKKTKGRVKIKMEFIENKLRRYTTFSKRKTGIMKKAYELSTLTGTQVMLLVASETGHVYTFATRKLQPMITSDSGKALIQTCLNSPDPPPGSSGPTSLEQRMNPSGFEETELTYSVGEEESKLMVDGMGGKPVFQMSPHTSLETHTSSTSLSVPSVSPAARQGIQTGTAPTAITTLTSQPVAMATQSSSLVTTSDNNSSSSNKVTGIPVQFPSLILQTGTGQPVAIPASHLGVSTSNTQPQAVYRAGQIVTNATNPNQTTSSESTSAAATPSLSFLSGSSATAVTPSQIIMYQTPQGVVYAAPTPSATLRPEGTIFNFQQPATAISIPQSDNVGGGQQIITIPVPVSLANTQQVLQLAASGGETLSTELPVQASPSKKPRKG